MTQHRSNSPRPWLLALLLVVLVGVGGVLLFFGARVGLSAWQLYSAASGLRALAAGPAYMEQAAVASELRRADEALAVLRTESDRLGPLLSPLLGQLAGAPLVGPVAAAAQDLLAVGDQGVRLASTLLARVQPHWTELQAQGNRPAVDLRGGLVLAAAAGNDIADLAPAFTGLTERAARAAAHESLPAPLRLQLAQLAQVAHLGAAVAPLGPHLDWLLGMESPRTLLVLAQNNDELRATGGFISAAGTLTVDKGKVTVNDLVDSYAIYRDDVDHPPAPAALQTYMQAYILLLRDANWSPDAPTSAQTAAALYKLDTGLPVDGVLLLDTGALAHLVEALGAVPLPARGVTVTADSLEQQLIDFWNPEPLPAGAAAVAAGGASSGTAPDKVVLPAGWWEQRKNFVPEVAHAVLQQVEAGDGDPTALVNALLAALDERSVQLWVDDPDTAAALNGLGWDGALAPEPRADFLAVVDSNVGFNKVDAVIARSVDYVVAWPPAGAATSAVAPTATVTLTYTHPLTVTDPGCDLTPRYGGTYASLTQRCYFDYVRVYAPAGSRLLDSRGLQPGSVTSGVGEHKLQVFAGYFVQSPGTVHTVTLTYALPATLQPDNYALVVQRQAGTGSMPLSVQAGNTAMSTDLRNGRLDWRP